MGSWLPRTGECGCRALAPAGWHAAIAARWRVGMLVLSACIVLNGCGGEQSMLNPQGPVAKDIADLWWWMFWGAAATLALVMGLALHAVLGTRERRRSIGGSAWVFLGGIALPVAVLTPLMVFGLAAGSRATKIDPDTRVIEVIGHQFWWEVKYPETDAITANEVRIPAGQAVHLKLQSADVIHSFWVPNLAGKMDVLPGKSNDLRLEADRPGVFRGQCAEFCGALHAHMTFHVVAEEPADFAAWLERMSQPAREPESERQQRGRQAFLEQGCGGCHRIRGIEAEGREAPDLSHVGSRYQLGSGRIREVTMETIAAWIVHKEHRHATLAMPVYGALDDDVLLDIATYLESLK